MKLIPIIAAVLGVLIGVIAFYAYPSVLMAENIGQALIMGGASGLSATGANQIIKQLQKGESNDDKDKLN